MLRQKRYSNHRTSLNHSKNHINANQNAKLISWTQEINLHQCNIAPSKNQNDSFHRTELREIQKNTNNRQENKFQGCISKPPTFFAIQQRYSPASKNKEQQNIFTKITELIRNEELGIPVCHSIKSKQITQQKNRPYTSLSHIARKSLDHSNFQGQVVLHLTKIEEPSVMLQQPERISTSRALMNYSKVYRNSSGDRFKVRRDKQFTNRFVHLSAQKMVLQQKQKKQKKPLQKIVQKPSTSYSRKRKDSLAERTKQRYAEHQQQFEIGGWEYFQ